MRCDRRRIRGLAHLYVLCKGGDWDLAHAFTTHKNGCPVLLALFASGRGC